MISRTEIRNTKSEIRNQSTDYTDFFKKSAIGFTLVELLVVISIIALLVGILLPSIGKAREYAANVRTSARVAELAGGCNMYFTENGYYPGQQYSIELKGSGGNFTGSQWLARSLFSDPDATPIFPQPKYAQLKATEDLFDYEVSSTEIYSGTISDRYTIGGIEPMAVLYYPARLGESGLGQYHVADNSDYTSGVGWYNSESHYPEDIGYNAALATFPNYIKDRRFQDNASTTPYAPGAFLIIAAGMDRTYGTSDDIHYPDFKSD